MAQLREMLNARRENYDSVEDFMYDINLTVRPEKDDRITVALLHHYLTGYRNITGKGARLLAKYFLAKNDIQMVDAISRVALGIPYPLSSSDNGHSIN